MSGKSHHLIYGTLSDYLTGEELIDTDDERIRQSLSKILVEEKGYSPKELLPRRTIDTLFSRSFVRSLIELTVVLENREFMIIRYAPGSLVSRERAAGAAARILNPGYQIPLAVVTNGQDAELINTSTGAILANGVHSIPDRHTALLLLPGLEFHDPPDAGKKEREMRILNAYDVERCCL